MAVTTIYLNSSKDLDATLDKLECETDQWIQDLAKVKGFAKKLLDVNGELNENLAGKIDITVSAIDQNGVSLQDVQAKKIIIIVNGN
jgi:hypothetical protein